MELSSLFGVLGNGWLDEMLIWAVASAVGLVALVAVANVLGMLFEAEVG